VSQDKKATLYPVITPFVSPQHIDEYPTGPGCPSGHLVEGHAAWRTLRPVVTPETCTGCWQCYLLCPDAAIYKDNSKAAINTDFCKGCGVCAKACPTQAITMIKEVDHER
jgi:pyruvate ferredoxin oxidoreductase delta subunit